MKQILILGLAAVLTPALASAQIRQVRSSASDANQTINFTIGGFVPRSLDTRSTDDVLYNELLNPGTVNGVPQPLLFNVSDFDGATFSGEYLVGIGRNLEAGVGLGYYQRTVPSVYANLTHPSGDEITQNLKLRMIPVTFTARYLPLPRGSSVEPYVGAGIVAIRWRYSETGEFVDESGGIFPANYVADGTAVGPVILAGVRVPFGAAVAGGEVRWQRAEGKGLLNQGFLGDKIDLGGFTGAFTIGLRF